MRISASNLAWTADYDDAVACVLRYRRIDAIDVAPGRYFDSVPWAEPDAVHGVRRWWERQGVEIVGLQGLMFGSVGLNMFDDSAAAMQDWLRHIFGVGAALGVRQLTFGSPRNRNRGHLDRSSADAKAREFFLEIADDAERLGLVLNIEPNAVEFGCDYLLDTAEAAHLVRFVSHPAVRLQIDAGNLASTGKAVGPTFAAHADVAGHVHASEPGLRPLVSHSQVHHDLGGEIQRRRPDLVVTLEMLPASDRPLDEAVDEALGIVQACYGGSIA